MLIHVVVNFYRIYDPHIVCVCTFVVTSAVDFAVY